jgi:UDP-N-acetylmuramate dehydrogenase
MIKADYDGIIDRLKAAEVGELYRNEPLCNHCSWRIGGPAEILAEPKDAEQLRKILHVTAAYKIPVIVIGHGTNILFDDAGLRGLVVKIGDRMSEYSIEGKQVHAGAGVWMPRLAHAVGNKGLTGLEHAIGIPGTLGGLVVMNGGSNNRRIGEVVKEVHVMNRRGQSSHFSRQDCRFSYRSSALQKSGLIVTEVEMELERGEPRAIRSQMLEILRVRDEKFPRKIPNCGSVFLSNTRMYERFGPPGKVIEETGLKGLRVGDAQVSHKHANFIVNLGGATSANIVELIHCIRERVYDRTGFWMDCEVRRISPEGLILPAHEAALEIQTS